MCKKLIIIGAGGHGRVVKDIAKKNGYEQIYFLDDLKEKKDSVIGRTSDFSRFIDEARFFIAIGNNEIRQKIYNELELLDAEIITLIHPNAVISDDVKIGKGTVIMAGAVINAETVIGNGVIINTCSSVDHDNFISDFTHISVGAHLCGNVNVGGNTMIGAGATVINNIRICDNCIVGAGTLVIRSIDESGTYIGVPSKKM